MNQRASHRTAARAIALLAVVALVVACAPAPTPSPIPPSASPPTPAFSAASLALEECDPNGDLPCEQQAATHRLAIPGSGVILTYSSEWAAGRTDRPHWDAGEPGLGGWSLDVLVRYDAANGVVVEGDGSWRLTRAVELRDGEQAVASWDGRFVYVFDALGRHARTVDALLGVTLLTFAYDGAGRLVGVQGSLDSQPIRLTVERSPDGTPERLLGADGAPTTLALDHNGHLAWFRDPAGNGTTITTTDSGLLTSYVDAAGGNTRYAYDPEGRLTSVIDPDAVELRFDRQASTDRIEVRVMTPLGRSEVYRAERVAGTISRTYVGADGATTVLTRDPQGSGTLSLPDGTKRTLELQPDPRFGLQAPTRTPIVEQRPDDVERRIEVAVAAEATDGDPLRLASWSRTTTIDGKAWIETVETATRSISTTDPDGRRSVRAYDEAGRIVLVTEPGRPDRAFSYDADGRLADETLGHGPTATTTRYGYDPDTGIVTITRPDGTIQLVGVDANGRVVRTSTGDGATVQLAYDAAGRLVQVRPPGHPSFTLGHSAAGRPTGFLPPVVADDATLEVRRLDADGGITAIEGPGDRALAVTYDDAGRAVAWEFDQGTKTTGYDPAGRPATLAAPGGITTELSYTGTIPSGLSWSGPVAGDVKLAVDAMGRVTSQSVRTADVAFDYDAGGLVTKIGDLSLERDPTSGLPVQATMGTTVTSWSYDADGFPTRSLTTVGGAIALDLRYERDALRRITAVTETRAGSPPTRTEYGYDPAGRLASVRRDGALVEEDVYDPAGNRVSVTAPQGKLVGAYDDRDRLASWGTVRYVYASDGTLASRTGGSGVTTYAFDDFGALRGATLPGGRALEYLVDGAGFRIGRKVDGRLVAGYLYSPDGLVLGELDGPGALVSSFAYDDQGHLAVIERAGRTYRVLTDHLGSPLLVLDSTSGEVSESISYDTWGRVIADANPGFQPFGFAGGLRDLDTGLVRFGARDYDPLTGRWTGPDPIRFDGGDANLYRYVAGDPVNRVDPSGLQPPKRFKCVAIACYEHGKSPFGPGVSVGAYSGSASGDFTCVGFECAGPSETAGCFVGYCSYGDPHLWTAQSRHLDFQGAGEFLAIVSTDGSIVVQVRQEPYGQSGSVSINTAVAASVNGDRVAVYTDDERPLSIGGRIETANDVSIRLPHGGIVDRHGTVVTVVWPGGSRLTVTRDGAPGAHLDFGFTPDDTIGPTLSGLLGTSAGGVAHDLTGRDGRVLDPADPAFATRLYSEFGRSWRISQAESLFDYRPGETTATFAILDFPRAAATVGGLDAAARTRAEVICRAVGVRSDPTLADCILDVGLTGDPSYAASAAAVQAATRASTTPPPDTGGGPAPTPEPGPSIPASSPRSGGALVPGQVANGSISSVGQRDRYTFSGAAGQIVYLETVGSCVNGLRWRLLDPNLREIGFDRLCADLGRRVLAGPGTYVVEIFSDGTATGDYGFELLDVPPVRSSAIHLADTVAGTIARIGEWHRYTFPATAGQIVYLRQVGACQGRLRWALLRPDDRTLTFDDGCHDLGRRVLPDTGTYAILVYADDTATGGFGFELLDVPQATTSAIRVGDTVSGAIGRIGEWHRYTFTASPGQTVVLEATQACIDGLRWHLLAPDGRELALDRTCVDLGRRVLPAAGTYVVEVYSDGTATGAYGLRLLNATP